MLLLYSLKSIAKGRQAGNRKQELKRDRKDCYLLNCSLWLALLAFLYNPQPPADIFTVEIPSSQTTPACASLEEKKKKKKS